MSEVRCNGCRHWFDSELWTCPQCDRERSSWNRALHVASLNSALYDQANAVVARDKHERAMLDEEYRTYKRYGIEPPGVPSREELARELAHSSPPPQ